MQIRFDNSQPSFKDIICFQRHAAWKPSTDAFAFVGSGKAALSLILHYLKYKKYITSKMSSVFVPQWMGIAVYQTLFGHCFPTKKYSSDINVIIAYHQYGFPQNMDKILDFCQQKKNLLIEDCAHVIDSKYKGTALGTFGDFSIYSFSKFCFCYALGGVSFKDPDFHSYLLTKKNEASKLSKICINAFKIVDEILSNKGVDMIKLRGMIYSLYSESFSSSLMSESLFLKKRKNEIFFRKKNYNYLKKSLQNYDFIAHLDSDVTPYAVPLLIKKNRQNIIEKIRNINLECGEYWFDTNRFVISPKFEKCILVPIHSKITIDHIDFITNTIKKEL